MKTKIQIKTFGGSVLFEYESSDNTIKKTLEEAVEGGADLSDADLRGADLSGAYLSGADLSRADLSDAYLRGADLRGAYLRGADLRGAKIPQKKLKEIQPYFQIIPEMGSFTAWKKGANGCLIKIEIPVKAKRVNSIGGRKCRAEFIKTLAIWDDRKRIKQCQGKHDSKIVYKVGELTYPDSFDPSPLIECSHGIHFFISKQEAKDW